MALTCLYKYKHGTGQYFVDDIGLEWKVVTDDQGTDIAVHGEPGEALVFPISFVAKRYVSRQTHFFVMLYSEMRKDIEKFMAQEE